MNCQKCNKPIEINDKFCRNCGEPIKNEHSDQFNYNYNYSNQTTPSYDMNANHQTQYTYSYNYNILETSEDDIYVQSYVGENYTRLKNTKFSIAAFFLGPTYLLYRKVWGYAFLYLVINIITTFILPELEILIELAINLFLGINFSKLYLKTARNNVEKIKNENLDKTTQQLIELCRKKGGTSIIAPILTFLGIYITIFISIIILAVI